MAARLRIISALLVAAASVASGCGPLVGGGPPAVATPGVTPQASFSAPVAATASLVRAALAGQGIGSAPPVVPYRPAEPAALGSAPRAVLQADVHDPGAGHIIVYELQDLSTTGTRGAEFADYLESGFGQTNYPLDAQFSLSQVGSTLIFTWWSASRAADPDLARLAFDTVAGVGQRIPVVK